MYNHIYNCNGILDCHNCPVLHKLTEFLIVENNELSFDVCYTTQNSLELIYESFGPKFSTLAFYKQRQFTLKLRNLNYSLVRKLIESNCCIQYITSFIY